MKETETETKGLEMEFVQKLKADEKPCYLIPGTIHLGLRPISPLSNLRLLSCDALILEETEGTRACHWK